MEEVRRSGALTELFCHIVLVNFLHTCIRQCLTQIARLSKSDASHISVKALPGCDNRSNHEDESGQLDARDWFLSFEEIEDDDRCQCNASSHYDEPVQDIRS